MKYTKNRKSNYTKFAEKFSTLCDNSGYSINEIADILNVRRETIWHYKVGNQYPRKHNLKKICKLFEVELSYFAGTQPCKRCKKYEISDGCAGYCKSCFKLFPKTTKSKMLKDVGELS